MYLFRGTYNEDSRACESILGSPLFMEYARALSRYPSSALFPFCLGVSLLKLNSRKKGAVFLKGLLEKLVKTKGAQETTTQLAQVMSRLRALGAPPVCSIQSARGKEFENAVIE